MNIIRRELKCDRRCPVNLGETTKRGQVSWACCPNRRGKVKEEAQGESGDAGSKRNGFRSNYQTIELTDGAGKVSTNGRRVAGYDKS